MFFFIKVFKYNTPLLHFPLPPAEKKYKLSTLSNRLVSIKNHAQASKEGSHTIAPGTLLALRSLNSCARIEGG